MSQNLLDDRQGDTGFNQVGRVGMVQRMHVRLLLDAALLEGRLEGQLEILGLNRRPRFRTQTTGEKPERRPMSEPKLPEQFQGLLGQRHITFLGSFAPNSQLHQLSVDVFDPEKSSFAQAQAAGINGG